MCSQPGRGRDVLQRQLQRRKRRRRRSFDRRMLAHCPLTSRACIAHRSLYVVDAGVVRASAKGCGVAQQRIAVAVERRTHSLYDAYASFRAWPATGAPVCAHVDVTDELKSQSASLYLEENSSHSFPAPTRMHLNASSLHCSVEPRARCIAACACVATVGARTGHRDVCCLAEGAACWRGLRLCDVGFSGCKTVLATSWARLRRILRSYARAGVDDERLPGIARPSVSARRSSHVHNKARQRQQPRLQPSVSASEQKSAECRGPSEAVVLRCST